MSVESAATAVESAETAQNSDSGRSDLKDAEAMDIESRVLAAMRSRVTYLREKADSFTFESVRRLLEEDLGLEKYGLDVHKSFVKQHLVQVLEGAGDDGASENSQETEKKDVTPVKEAAESHKDPEAKKNMKEDAVGDDEKTEDSPVMGLLTEDETFKSVAEEAKEESGKEALQGEIRKALRKRASYIKGNSEKITMALLRRLLEKDLKLGKYTLDTYKTFISEVLDEVLQTPDVPKTSTEAKGKNLKNKLKNTVSKKVSSEESSASGGEDDEEKGDEEEEDEDEEVVVKKKTGQKRKIAKAEEPRKRKRGKATTTSVKKKTLEGSDIVSDDGHSQSSSEKPLKQKKEATTTAVYGKRVENLKSIIKSCGMSVPPSIYRKAKQAPEEKREEALIKELEQILAKEGLSSNPSEKEIKDVKKRKERARELEGIDTSNIVSSSRRSSARSFVPLPKPKITDESESDESEDEEDEADEDEDEGGKDEGEESQSGEESNDEEEEEEEASE